MIDYLLLQEKHFSLIGEFNVHSFNEWSDHAILSFKVTCNTEIHKSHSFLSTYHKWDDEYKHQFRVGIISQLPLFNVAVDNIDCTSRQFINDAVNSFTNIIRSVADPLFSKTRTFTDIPYFNNNKFMKRAEWFDAECSHMRSIYLESVRVFNENKCEINRLNLLESKKCI